jgi:flavin-dependent thymidylate synthase
MDSKEKEVKTQPHYPSVEIPQFGSKISLILRSEAPLLNNDLSLEEKAIIDSAIVIAGQAGRMCYSNTSSTPLDYHTKSDKYREGTESIAKSTREAGHSSTREHVHYTFKIDGISRNAIYYLHSHPHYVTDMQSQRYCNLAETNPIVPEIADPESQKKADEAVKNLVAGYNHLYGLLTPTTKSLILERFPSKNNPQWEDKINEDAGKKAQEIARYLLPLGTPTNLDHTISELTLIRLYHLSQTLPVQPETRQIIEGMVNVITQVDPRFIEELNTPLEPDDVESVVDFTSFTDEFDSLIAGYPIKIDADNQKPSQKLARGVRETLGKNSQELPDAAALELLLNPQSNKMLIQNNGDIVIDRLGQCLNQVNVSALVSISHVANEQFHRHRAFNHTEQVQFLIPQNDRDIIVPTILEKNPAARDYYLEVQKQHNQVLRELYDQGVHLDKLQYLLTNATRIRKSINAPFGSLLHFLKLRTCLTAQEEIYHLALSLTKQLIELDPALKKYLQNPSPCGMRKCAGVKPFCQEADRTCGVRIWDISTINDFPKRYI